MIRSNHFAESFGGVTPPAIPATIVVDTGITTVGSAPINSNNALQLTGTASPLFWESANAGNADGNDHFTFKFRFDDPDSYFVPIWSQTATFLSGGAGTSYILAMSPTAAPLTIYKDIVGTLTAIGPNWGGGVGVLGANTDFAANVTYTWDVTRAFDVNGDGWIQAYISRASDGKYFRIREAVWDDGKVPAYSFKDGSITAQATKCGAEFYNPTAGDHTYHDDIQFDRAWPITYHAWGDSLTMGTQASNGGYPVLLETSLNTSIQNHGLGGFQAIDVAAKMYSEARAAHASTILFGVNDAIDFGYGNSTTKRDTYFARALTAAILTAAMPTVSRADAATQTGTWLNGAGPIGYETTIRYSVDPGDKLSFSSMTGDVLYALYTAHEVLSGTFDVKLGGTVLASIDTTGAGIESTALVGTDYGPQAVRVTGAGSGSHTIDFVVTNADSGLMDGLIALGNNTGAMKNVYVGNLAHIAAAGYATYFSSHANLAAANAWIDSYNTVIAAVVAQLAGDGIPVTLVDVVGTIDPNTDLTADGLHWNNTGQAKVAAAFSFAISPPSFRARYYYDMKMAA